MRKRLLILALAVSSVLGGGATRIVQDQCGPFSDVTPAFCPFILELWSGGVTAGTSPTTFSPDDPLTRGQGAVFVAKGLNQSLARSSRRAALGQWWTSSPAYDLGLGVTTVGNAPEGVASDGRDIWVANNGSGTVSRVRGSDGRLLETWTAAGDPVAVLVAMGRVFVTSIRPPDGTLFMIDPGQAPGPVTAVATLPPSATGLAFDGSRLWTANLDGSVSIITPSAALPWDVATVSTGFVEPAAAVFDGANVWVTDVGASALLKLGSDAAILQTVQVGSIPSFPVFDGTNIWVPNHDSGSLSIVRASDGLVLATLTGNGLQAPSSAAFDGERILIVNGPIMRPGDGTFSVFRAADLSPIGSFVASGFAACSDGSDFWITLQGTNQLARF